MNYSELINDGKFIIVKKILTVFPLDSVEHIHRYQSWPRTKPKHPLMCPKGELKYEATHNSSHSNAEHFHARNLLICGQVTIPSWRKRND